MAKNYTFAEVVGIVNEGKDMESIADIGRRYPVLLHKVTAVATLAGAAFVDLMSFMPDHLTANKVNTAIKNAGTSADADEDEADEAVEVEAEAEATKSTDTETDYESMSGKELWDLCGKLGIRKNAKSSKKTDLLEVLKAYHANKGDEAEEVEDADEPDTAEENPYEGKSAMELFKECKKRGIKAAPKKTAKFYADLLIKDDAKAAEADSDESEDWEDEEEAEVPTKEEKKSTAKATKKAEKPAKKAESKKAATEDDEDDDWDI